MPLLLLVNSLHPNIQYPNVHFKILNNSTTDSVNAHSGIEY